VKRLTLIATALLLALPLAAGADIITPVIVASDTSGPSPLAVNFDAYTSTTHTDSDINTARFYALLYEWDFKDTASGTWTPTGNSRNLMTGGIGAHVFEPSSFPDCGGTCKTFDVRVDVTDENGHSHYDEETITVYDPDSTGANGWGDSGETVCVSKVDDFTNCPAVGDECGTAASCGTGDSDSIIASRISAGYRRILFHGGETWDHGASLTLSTTDDALIGSYDTVAEGDATFNIEVDSAFKFSGASDNLRIQDLTFTSAGYDPKSLFVTATSATSGVTNFLLQRTTTADDSTEYTWEWPITHYADSTVDNDMHRHIFIVDNDWGYINSLPSGRANYHIYTVGWGLSILGNTFGHALNGSHTIRVVTGEDVLISNNDFGPGYSGYDTINIRDLPNSCTSPNECDAGDNKPFCGRLINHYIIQDNDVECGSGAYCVDFGLRTCYTEDDHTKEIEEQDVIWERNYFYAASGNTPRQRTISMVRSKPTRVVIRNNVFDMSDFTDQNIEEGIQDGRDTGYNAFGPVYVINNTCYTDEVSSSEKVYCARLLTSPTSDLAYNNVLYAPNGTSSNDMDNRTGGEITSNPFASGTPASREDFLPGSGSKLLDAGGAVRGLFLDALMTERTGDIDVGALEYESGAGSSATISGGGAGGGAWP
jgi:hypothetical protein